MLEEYGMQSAEAFFPYAEADGWKSIGVYTFSRNKAFMTRWRALKHSKSWTM